MRVCDGIKLISVFRCLDVQPNCQGKREIQIENEDRLAKTLSQMTFACIYLIQSLIYKNLSYCIRISMIVFLNGNSQSFYVKSEKKIFVRYKFHWREYVFRAL